ncbi:diguanylate cyclase (GGDEF)-like protein [Devosia sp. UYZn731]|uniref:putative bifunctional diguanylate cyclase/phosphodiesterase n=1 Tax=Devosia sp. UYZn731 TaxID=3156345 RepID=UPI0033931ED9
MISNRTKIFRSVSSSLVWLLLLFGLALLSIIGVGTWWAVGRIDAWSEAGERHLITAGLNQEEERLPVAQNRFVVWDDAVAHLLANHQSWIGANLVEGVSDFYAHDRVYVIAPDGHVVRSAEAGRYAGQGLKSQDEAVVSEMVRDLRERMARASAGQDDSTATVTGLGIVDAVRLSDEELAYVSVRPIVPTSSAIKQTPGDEYVHISVKLISAKLLEGLGTQFGFDDLHLAGRNEAHTTLPVLSNSGGVVGYVAWKPRQPALGLLVETAPASLGILCFGAASLLALIAWLRRTTIKLELSQDRTTYLSLHDPLTGIANRVLFETRLKEAMEYEYLAPTKVALVSIDLDGFKEVNDTLGHAAGDELIRQVAKRLAFALPEEATVARLGGDEFALVQPGMVSEGQAHWICDGLVRAFRDPFVLGAEIIEVTASFGVSLEEGSQVQAAEMQRRADVALYVAKAEGRNRLKFYKPEMDASRREKRTLEVDLRNALLTGEGLFVLFQPIFSISTGAIAGAEALVRWHHPTRGLLSPDVFIRIAEETGIINQLGNWVLEEACRVAVEVGLPWIAVNISPVQVREQEFGGRVMRALDKTGLPANRLELEITEGLLLQNSSTVQAALAQLQGTGIRVALDDFGTGYSSISYLRTYKLNKLKIDQSFIRLMCRDPVTRSIVQSVIQMADALGMTVTAEGVEEEEQRQLLTELGCTQLQGFLLSRPVTADRLSDLLSQQRSAA